MSDQPGSQSGLQRRPVPEFEDLYEITRRGDVYSRRLGRFIKQGEFTDGCGVIEFQVDKRKYQLPVATAVAEVFLTDDDKQDIIAAVPNLDELPDDDICAHPVIEAMAEQHNVIPEAIVSVLLRARRAA